MEAYEVPENTLIADEKYIGSRTIVGDTKSVSVMCESYIPKPFRHRISSEQLSRDVNDLVEVMSQDPRIEILKSKSPAIIKETDNLVSYFFEQIRHIIHTYELGED